MCSSALFPSRLPPVESTLVNWEVLSSILSHDRMEKSDFCQKISSFPTWEREVIRFIQVRAVSELTPSGPWSRPRGPRYNRIRKKITETFPRASALGPCCAEPGGGNVLTFQNVHFYFFRIWALLGQKKKKNEKKKNEEKKFRTGQHFQLSDFQTFRLSVKICGKHNSKTITFFDLRPGEENFCSDRNRVPRYRCRPPPLPPLPPSPQKRFPPPPILNF